MLNKLSLLELLKPAKFLNPEIQLMVRDAINCIILMQDLNTTITEKVTDMHQKLIVLFGIFKKVDNLHYDKF